MMNRFEASEEMLYQARQKCKKQEKEIKRLREAAQRLIDASHGMGGDFDQVFMDAISNAVKALEVKGE